MLPPNETYDRAYNAGYDQGYRDGTEDALRNLPGEIQELLRCLKRSSVAGQIAAAEAVRAILPKL
jgi:flagellar biosynthesis/type III secretory pathway protein FliH